MGIATYIAENAISCVAKGTGLSLEHFDIIEKTTIQPGKRTSKRNRY